GKTYFTIMDFRNVSRHFADPAFDGMPEAVMEITENDPVTEPTDNLDVDYGYDENEDVINDSFYGEDDYDGDDEPRKYYVDDVQVNVISDRKSTRLNSSHVSS